MPAQREVRSRMRDEKQCGWWCKSNTSVEFSHASGDSGIAPWDRTCPAAAFSDAARVRSCPDLSGRVRLCLAVSGASGVSGNATEPAGLRNLVGLLYIAKSDS